MKKQLILCIAAAAFIFSGCDSNSTSGIDDNGGDHNKPLKSTVYVVNEGNFSDSNGSITTYKAQSKTAIQKKFQAANGRPLAGYIQSSNVIGDSLYVVLNNPNKIEVVDLNSFESVGTIDYSKTPTFIAKAADGKAYVTNLYGGSVSIVNLETMEETNTTIPVGTNPYFGYQADGKVFISNNGFGSDNTVSVIDIASGSVVKTLTVGAGPKQITEDPAGNLWVICEGKVAYDADFNRVPENDIPGSIYIINPANLTVTGSIDVGGQPVQMAIDGKDSRAYVVFSGGNVEEININTLQVVNTAFISRTFNTIGYSSAQGMLYLGQSKGLTQPGKVILYNMKGAAVDSFATGISPIGFQFAGK